MTTESAPDINREDEPQAVQRTCTTCDREYIHEPAILLGREMKFLDSDLCSECRSAAADAKERSIHEAVAAAELGRVVPPAYRQTDINHPEFPVVVFRAARAWSRGGGVGSRPHHLFLGLVGESGAGKTRVMAQTIRTIIQGGRPCEWVNATRFQWSCRHEHSKGFRSEAGRSLELYRSHGVLAFDDLDKVDWDSKTEAKFYDLLEHRTAHAKPMIWTSCTSLDELGSHFSRRRRDPILGRLCGFSNLVRI